MIFSMDLCVETKRADAGQDKSNLPFEIKCLLCANVDKEKSVPSFLPS